LASAEIVGSVVMSAMMSDCARRVCSVVHRAPAGQESTFGRHGRMVALYKNEQPRARVSHTIGDVARDLRRVLTSRRTRPWSVAPLVPCGRDEAIRDSW
jgi:hypothetical protein